VAKNFHASIARSVTKADRQVEIGGVDIAEDIIQHTDTTAGILCACRERPRRDELAASPLQANIVQRG